MDNNETYTILVKNDLVSVPRYYALYIESNSIKLMAALELAREYRYQDMESAGLFQEYGIIYFKDGSSLLFKGALTDPLKRLSSTEFNKTKKIVNEITNKLSLINHESKAGGTTSAFEISLIYTSQKLKQLAGLKINRDDLEITREGRVIKKVRYEAIRNVRMLSEFGCIDMENFDKIRFISGRPGKINLDKQTYLYTKMITEKIKHARSSKMESLFRKPEEKGFRKDPNVIKIVKRKAVNEDYWRIYEQSASRGGKLRLNPDNEIECRIVVKYLFQNAVCFILLGNYQDAEKAFANMKKYYRLMSDKKYGSTDLFRLFAADYLFEAYEEMSHLFKAIKTLNEREYRDDIDEKNTGKSFIKPGDKNIKKIYRLIDRLQLSRIAYLSEDYEEAAIAIKQGQEIIKSINLDLESSTPPPLPVEPDIHRTDEEVTGLRLRIWLYDRMFSILSGLIRNVTWHRGVDKRVLLEELPLFFDEYINPYQKKFSYFSIEEEVQWALIYYLSCQRILGLFYDMPHHIALRKFLG